VSRKRSDFQPSPRPCSVRGYQSKSRKVQHDSDRHPPTSARRLPFPTPSRRAAAAVIIPRSSSTIRRQPHTRVRPALGVAAQVAPAEGREGAVVAMGAVAETAAVVRLMAHPPRHHRLVPLHPPVVVPRLRRRHARRLPLAETADRLAALESLSFFEAAFHRPAARWPAIQRSLDRGLRSSPAARVVAAARQTPGSAVLPGCQFSVAAWVDRAASDRVAAGRAVAGPAVAERAARAAVQAEARAEAGRAEVGQVAARARLTSSGTSRRPAGRVPVAAAGGSSFQAGTSQFRSRIHRRW
jgi:hypothetical protein